MPPYQNPGIPKNAPLNNSAYLPKSWKWIKMPVFNKKCLVTEYKKACFFSIKKKKYFV